MVQYANTVEGASNSIQLLNFFGEAGKVSNSNGNQAIEFGDILLWIIAPFIGSKGDIFYKDVLCR